MGARDLRRLIAILAASILLAASGESYGSGPGEQTCTSETSPVTETQPFRTSPPTYPRSPSGHVGSLLFPGQRGSPGQLRRLRRGEVETREPSFGGESPAPEVSDPIEPVNRGSST